MSTSRRGSLVSSTLPPLSPGNYAAHYSYKADAFYQRVILEAAATGACASTPAASPTTTPKVPNGRLRIVGSSVIKHNRELRTSMWDHAFGMFHEAKIKRHRSMRHPRRARTRSETDDPFDEDAKQWRSMQDRFKMINTRKCMRAAIEKPAMVSGRPMSLPGMANRAAAMHSRRGSIMAERDHSLRETFASTWGEATSPAWEVRTTPAWGGVGWTYDYTDTDGASLSPGWVDHVNTAADAFETRQRAYHERVRGLLNAPSPRLKRPEGLVVSMADASRDAQAEFEACMQLARSNKIALQPVRLGTSAVAPNTSPRAFALEAYKHPLAIVGNARGGGPLVPVHHLKLSAQHDFIDDAPPPPSPRAWSLYGSIWGPRCEWCDGGDFYDHEEVSPHRLHTIYLALACDVIMPRLTCTNPG